MEANLTPPRLVSHGSAKQLVADGQPFLMLAAELNNSSASSPEYMAPLWPKLVATHLNTVLATVSWELIEPEDGKFDFTLVDRLLSDARAHRLRLVLLWFASWKNGKSNYQPMWVKANQERFPLAVDEQGRSMPILTTLSATNRDADARAFAAFMRHLHEMDGRTHTVLMVQVENEVGILGDSRDYSPAANAAFAGQVPAALMDYLVAHRETLIREFREAWEAHGAKTTGTWEQVFGSGKPAGTPVPVRTLTPPLSAEEHETGWRKPVWAADEIFMAWHYARYVNAIAEAGKAEYNLPMFVNAWLQQRDHAWPGTYPSGGPVPQVMDVWRAGAPCIDILAPDLYVPEFAELCARYTRSDNPLFIPETANGAAGAANAFYAFGRHDAICFSPFGADRFVGEDPDLADAYSILDQLSRVILANQGTGKMTAVLLEGEDSAERVHLGGYEIEVRYATLPFWRPEKTPPPMNVAALLIATGPDEFLIAGRNVHITFSLPADQPELVGLGTVDEGAYVDGKWIPGRRLNGDETPEWHSLRFGGDRYRIQHVKLYRYR